MFPCFGLGPTLGIRTMRDLLKRAVGHLPQVIGLWRVTCCGITGLYTVFTKDAARLQHRS